MACLGLLGAAPIAPQPRDQRLLAEHVRVLSSDAFEGRAPGTDGERRTIAYITEEFRRIGLKPGGDPRPNGARAWTQRVPMFEAHNEGPVRISVSMPEGVQQWTQGEEMVVRASLTGIDRLAIDKAPLVFVGYGVSAPERGWDDFKGVDLHGKIAVALVNDPDFESGHGDFGGKAMTYYGRWTYKYEEAARRGAIGMIVIHEDAAASYGWKTVSNSSRVPLFDIARPNPATVHPVLEAWIQHDRAADLFSASGLDFKALKALAATRAFHPVTLNGVTLSVLATIARKQIETFNVVGRLPGIRHPDETVLFGAHWDHLGVGPPDATGDRIYNGAVDNASGVAALIEIAHNIAALPRADRSLVFTAWTNEERGILGSEYYATHPLYPLATTVADITIDGLFPMGRAKDFSTFGYSTSSLNDMLIDEARRMGRTYTPDPHPEAGLPYRSDHFPLAKRGVPALLFASGEDLIVGGRAAGLAYVTDYFANRYHQPGDQFDANWKLDGIAADVQLLATLGQRLASIRTWPSWTPDAEFQLERERSASARR